ncbi:MAG TPA: hypothetical protein VMA75_03995 [Candidatus Paceibacterota bacterium]|nr:hypothetical protein [Candidatus Paceibacterota bacterium]
MPEKKMAHLKFCPPCGRLAWIVLGDGRRTHEFGSRRIGRALVMLLAKNGHISHEEALAFNNQINTSRLREKVCGWEDEDLILGSLLASEKIEVEAAVDPAVLDDGDDFNVPFQKYPM